MTASPNRDMQKAFRRSSGGFDLVLGPVLMALVGLWVDSLVGTTPIIAIVFLVGGFVGAVFKVYFEYQRWMEESQAELAAMRAETARLKQEAGHAADAAPRDFTRLLASQTVVAEESEAEVA